jgi:hypothetical protein
MDHSGLSSQPDSHTLIPPSTPTGTSRGLKRSREDETPSQRHKREKAAERQRRKRERDRQVVNSGAPATASASAAAAVAAVHAAHAAAAAVGMLPGVLGYPPPLSDDHHMSQSQLYPPPMPPMDSMDPMDGLGTPQTEFEPVSQSQSRVIHQTETNLSSDELARRERVRAAARERQRKHRALVKQKKMRELGLDMGNELPAGFEPPEFAAVYQQTAASFPPPLNEAPPQHVHPPTAAPSEPLHQAIMNQPQPEPSLPVAHGQPIGGQTFASTLLLSFSCAPILKQHLLRTLSMTNDELASLEPVIAHAWDQWDHDVCHHELSIAPLLIFSSLQRRMHYAKQAAEAVTFDPNGGRPMGEPSEGSTPDLNAQLHHHHMDMAAANFPPPLPPSVELDPELVEADEQTRRSASSDAKEQVEAHVPLNTLIPQ